MAVVDKNQLRVNELAKIRLIWIPYLRIIVDLISYIQ